MYLIIKGNENIVIEYLDGSYLNDATIEQENKQNTEQIRSLILFKHNNIITVDYIMRKPTVLPAKSDSDVMSCLQCYQGLIIDRSLV